MCGKCIYATPPDLGMGGILGEIRADTNYYKWKNHYYEMKGDVRMSGHDKERKQEDAYTKSESQ